MPHDRERALERASEPRIIVHDQYRTQLRLHEVEPNLPVPMERGTLG